MYKINTSNNLNYNNFDKVNLNKNNDKKNNDDNKQNFLKYLFNYSNSNSNMINEDTRKMHLLPPNCPMTPKTYTNFFNTNTNTNTNTNNLSGVAPYKVELVRHPREGYKHTIEYRNFYSDFNKDVLDYKSDNNEVIINSNNGNRLQSLIINNDNDENIKLYKETKPHNDFATPMKINGSNKVEDLFDNCMNKKTFEYKRYSTISPHHNQWIDNPLFTNEISQDTEKLKTNYMNSREESNMNTYSSVFEDMYIMTNMTNNKLDFNNPSNIKKVEDELKNYDITADYSNTKIKEKNKTILDQHYDKRNLELSKIIKPNNYNTKRFIDL